jgi:hypothetical protein
MRAMMDVSPIAYVRDATLRGRLFGSDIGGVVANADTGFFADHKSRSRRWRGCGSGLWGGCWMAMSSSFFSPDIVDLFGLEFRQPRVLVVGLS